MCKGVCMDCCSLYCSENHTSWQICNCYCFLKLVHKRDAENSNLVNNFNWILRAKCCQSLVPLVTPFSTIIPLIWLRLLLGFVSGATQINDRAELHLSTETWYQRFLLFLPFPSILLRLRDSIPYPRPPVLILQGYQRGWMCCCWASITVILFPSSLGTAWRPEQVLISSGHDPFLLWKMSIQFPNSYPTTMPLGYCK